MNECSQPAGVDDSRLILLVTGDAPRSERARTNLGRALTALGLCRDRFRVVDLIQHPEETFRFGVYATPALVGISGSGHRSVIYGDLSEESSLEDFLRSNGVKPD